MTEAMPAEATVVIITKNRPEDLRRALASCLAQDVPCEVLVIDDGSTDDTAKMVTLEFPSVRLVRHAESQGYVVRRNEAAALATAPYIVSIDDDAEFSTATVVGETLENFDHPLIGAVSIPHADVLTSSNLKTPSPPAPGRWAVSAYIGTAHALRRDLFLRLGGYRGILAHSTEERDLCVRLYDHGYFVRLGTAPPVYHYASPVRDSRRARMLERRNDLCHAFWDVPMPHLLYHLPGTLISGLRYALVNHCFKSTLAGYAQAPGVFLRTWRMRAPVRGSIYLLIRRLNRRRLLPLAEVEPLLTPKTSTR